MRVGFVLKENFKGRYQQVGSSRIRGHWIMKHWPGAEEYDKRNETKYDAIIFQKVSWPRVVRRFEGVKVYDICDIKPKIDKEMGEWCDVFVAPNHFLLERFQPKPCYVIRDGHDPDFYKVEGRVKIRDKVEWVSWFGYHTGFPLLNTMIPMVRRLGLKLKVISDQNHPDADESVKYDDSTINRELLSTEVVLDPRDYETWKNPPEVSHKTGHAMKLGLPVASRPEELMVIARLNLRDRAAFAEGPALHIDARDESLKYQRIVQFHINKNRKLRRGSAR